jgi:hypothetical protein
MSVDDWKREWLKAGNPWEAYEAWERHWLSLHPEDESREEDDEAGCLALIDKYAEDPEVLALSREHRRALKVIDIGTYKLARGRNMT